MHVEPPSQKLKLNYEKIFQITFFLINEITLVLHKKPMLLSTKKEKKKEG